MGKTRKPKRVAASRSDPVGLDSAIAELEKGMDQDSDLGGAGSVLQTMLAQLQSVNPEDRVCGCHTLSRHSDSPQFVQTALQAKVARVCAPLLIESDPVLKLAAVGALKNLSVRDPDTAEALVEQDVLTPLCSLLASYPPDWSPAASSSSRQDVGLLVLVQALELLWNLVEASDTALQLFNNRGLLEVVVRQCRPDLPHDLVLAALSTLAAATDSNPTAVESLLASEGDLLVLAQEPHSLSVRVTVSVILLNLHGQGLYTSPTFPLVIEVVSACLSTPLPPLSPSCQEEMEVGGGQEDAEERSYRHVLETVRAQYTALEVLVNLGSLEEEDEWQDHSDSEDEQEQEDEEELNRVEVNPVFSEAIACRGLVTKVLLLANDLPEGEKEVLGASQQGRELLGQHKALRTRVFLCLSNLTCLLSLPDLGGLSSLHSTWQLLGNLCFTSTCPLQGDLQEAATAAMRATTARICGDPGGRGVLRLGPEELGKILELYSGAGEAAVRTNVVQTVGEVAGMAAVEAGDTASQEVLAKLAVWLVDTAARDSDLLVAGEALDKFMDVFSADCQDQLFARLGLLNRLKHSLDVFKSRLEQNKRQLGASLPILQQARSNLQRFVKYKQKRPLIAAASK